MPRPLHRNPGPARTATAPYNFIPLPERVVNAADSPDQLPSHVAGFALGKYSGFFDVELTTRSPLYIRCPLSRDQFDLNESGQDRYGNELQSDTPFQDRIRNAPDFFHRGNIEHPVIPASSLRGMLRTMVEIVGHGKLEQVSERQLFYRTMDGSALGAAYVGRMVDGSGDPGDGYRPSTQAGFFRILPRGTYAIEPCNVARVELHAVRQAFGLPSIPDLFDGAGPMATPKWQYQHERVWVQLDPLGVRDHPHNGKHLRYWKVLAIESSSKPGYTQGTLVLTGHVQGQHMGFVFLGQPGATAFDIDPETVDRFYDDDQVSQWQELAFPRNQPTRNARRQAGHLRDSEPVFYLMERGRLSFFGRAQMFRLPYQQRVVDLVPEDLRRPTDIDYADALFGYVRKSGYPADAKQGHPSRAYAGRVSVTDARFAPSQTGTWYRDEPIRPKRLASPKPTAIQHYLVQTADEAQIQRILPQHLVGQQRQLEVNKKLRKSLLHYDSNGGGAQPSTVARGIKVYWSQQQPGIEADQHEPVSHAQDTQLRPIDTGKRFTFRVHFDNLAAEELGALCWALRPQGNPQRQFWHRLGMGKPLGMGAVELQATLHLIDRRKRYSQLFAGASWRDGAEAPQPLGLWAGQDVPAGQENTPGAFLRAFEKAILRGVGAPSSQRRLADIPRVQMLLKMLDSEGQPPANVRTLPLQGGGGICFRDRPVLPDPLGVGPNRVYRIPIPQSGASGGGPVEVILADPVLQRQINSFKGPGEAGKLDDLVSKIQALEDAHQRHAYAEMLMKEIKKHKKLKSDPKYVNADWRKALDRILQGS